MMMMYAYSNVMQYSNDDDSGDDACDVCGVCHAHVLGIG
jgi:hypothetical protein